MRAIATLASAFVLLAAACDADDSDGTLRFYLSKSDLVVVGTIVDEPTGITSELGVPNYICEFRISHVCKGDMELVGKTIRVNIKRFEMGEKDHHPLIKKNAECILFMKREIEGTIPQWVTADFWFGIQHPIPWMVKSLERIAKQQAEDVEQSSRHVPK